MAQYEPGAHALCKRCREASWEHVNGECPVRADVQRGRLYGADNPTVAWLREHAPEANREKAETVVEPEDGE